MNLKDKRLWIGVAFLIAIILSFLISFLIALIVFIIGLLVILLGHIVKGLKEKKLWVWILAILFILFLIAQINCYLTRSKVDEIRNEILSDGKYKECIEDSDCELVSLGIGGCSSYCINSESTSDLIEEKNNYYYGYINNYSCLDNLLIIWGPRAPCYKPRCECVENKCFASRTP
ncbi:MAG: hypothetical protein JSV92_03040 [archaeon]|nr:MAG: hypothetical protein JSV92_03040 [archaeon]